MNKRNRATCCCGTCQYWEGKRKKEEKENIINNEIKISAICDNKGTCLKNKQIKNNNSKCSKYVRWFELDI